MRRIIINNIFRLVLATLLIFLNGCVDSEKDLDDSRDIPKVPPFSGTIFLDPDIITEDDSTTFLSLEDAGTGSRTMYDRRNASWVTLDAYLFDALYTDDRNIEVQVNPEFETTDLARAEAAKYAEVIGRLPAVLLKDVYTVWIHKGNEPFGGGNNNLLIHIDNTEYEKKGILEETLVHEASHTSLDAYHAEAADWLTAQKNDDTFISTYAQDHPLREDIAESFLVYFAIRYRADKISTSVADTIINTIPNRIEYFDNQNFDVSPFQ